MKFDIKSDLSIIVNPWIEIPNVVTDLGVMYIKMLIKKVKLQKVGNCFGNLALGNIHFQFLNFTCQKNRDVQEIHRDMRGLETI